MGKKTRKYLIIGTVLFALFLLFTCLVATVDVHKAGPAHSSVGFAKLNEGVFNFFGGEHRALYRITNVMGIVSIAVAVGFAGLGVYQLITRKKFKLVDKSLYVLGVFYVILAIEYLLFESFVINCRPILIAGVREASYPSSHTMLAVAVMVTTSLQLRDRIEDKKWKLVGEYAPLVIAAFTVIARLISGAHWLTDIIGGLILSAALVCFYVSGVYALTESDEEEAATEEAATEEAATEEAATEEAATEEAATEETTTESDEAQA